MTAEKPMTRREIFAERVNAGLIIGEDTATPEEALQQALKARTERLAVARAAEEREVARRVQQLRQRLQDLSPDDHSPRGQRQRSNIECLLRYYVEEDGKSPTTARGYVLFNGEVISWDEFMTIEYSRDNAFLFEPGTLYQISSMVVGVTPIG